MLKTSNQVKKVPNPTGKGGFQERPQDRSDGRWSKDNSFSYWMNKFKTLPKDEFLKWEEMTPPEQQTMAASLAYARVYKARKELKEFQEVANRTEGMPMQRQEITGADGGPIKVEDFEALEKVYGNDSNRELSNSSKSGGSTKKPA